MPIHFNLLGEVCTCVTMGRRNKSGDDRKDRSGDAERQVLTKQARSSSCLEFVTRWRRVSESIVISEQRGSGAFHDPSFVRVQGRVDRNTAWIAQIGRKQDPVESRVQVF